MTAPAYARRVVRLPAEELREGGRVLACTLYHMRDRDGAIVCAEGEAYKYTSMVKGTDLFGFGKHLACYMPEEKAIHYLDNSLHRTAPMTFYRLQSAFGADGEEYVYHVGPSLIYAHSQTEETVSCGLITDCSVAAYRDRAYAPKGRTVRFSKLLNLSGSGWREEEAEQGWSTFEVSPVGGNIVDALPVHDKLCFLREYGITLLTAYADVYNFRLSDIPYDCGKIVPRTGAVCCGDLYFFTERGLCVFDGTKASRAENAADGDIDLAQDIRMSVRGNILYASVTAKDGGKTIYAYEPYAKRGRYLLNEFIVISVMEGAYLLRKNLVYELTGRAIPEGKRCRLCLTLTFADLYEGEKRMEALVIEGAGDFRVSVTGEAGTAVTAAGRANVRLELPAAVRGETFAVELSTEDPDFCIRAVSFCMRREDRV